jgi:hypothetical protein
VSILQTTNYQQIYKLQIKEIYQEQFEDLQEQFEDQ